MTEYISDNSPVPASHVEIAKRPVQQERMSAVLRAEMLPHSGSELNHMYALMQPRYNVGGGLKYINEISNYVKNDATDSNALPPVTFAEQLGISIHPDTRETQRDVVKLKIVNHMLDYVQDAQQTINSLKILLRRLSNPSIDHGELLGDQQLIHDGPVDTRRAMGVLTRYIESVRYVTGGINAKGVINTDFMQVTGEIKQRIRQATDDMSIDDTQNNAVDLYDIEIRRLNFWVDQLIGHPKDDQMHIARRYGVTDSGDLKIQNTVQTRLYFIARNKLPQ